ncbi:MAG: putative selenium-dependent hydroxylase accessory protein YqeC [Anaerolineae bacterium]|nr:putative selenium-dependent hydroxylase accessory protein YqeC [Anaerolineae bacterium]
MKLSQALDLIPGDVVSFVGAGGKTSAMFRLANELSGQGWRVVSTTTTRIAQDELHRAPQRVGFGHGMQLPDTLPEQVDIHRHVFVFGKTEPDGKVRGVRPAWLDSNLARASYLDALLVESDGSRRRPMKAPLPHEPAMPRSSTVVIPVVGLDALGQPLDEKHIYGARVIHNTTGYPIGKPVTTRLMAAVIMSPQLGLKNVPRQARIIPLLNQVTEAHLLSAREIATYTLTDYNIERVLIGAVQGDEPIWEIQRRVGAIILAAGESQRMGKPKMLLPWKSSTIIREICQQVLTCRLHEVVVVAGEDFEAIQQELDNLPVRVVHNAQGEMLSSLKVGLHHIWHTSSACMIVLGDQPEIRADTFHLILNCYNQGLGRIVAPAYNNRRGHPVLIDRAFWRAIDELPSDKAPRDVLQTYENEVYHLAVNTASVLSDIDTSEDYEQARRRSGQVNEQ